MQLIYNKQITPPHTNGREVSRKNTFATLKAVCTNRVRRLFVYILKHRTHVNIAY